MKTTFLVSLNQMGIFFLFMLIGYFFQKKKVTPENASDTLSKLLLWLFMPATCFRTFAENCTRETVVTRAPLLLMSFGLLLASIGLAWVLSRVLTPNERTREVYLFGLIVANFGYLGYSLIEAVYGGEMLFEFMVFGMPFNMFIYSFGMFIFRPDKKLNLNIFTSPTIVAIFVGIAVGLIGIPLPAFFTGVVSGAAGCMTPAAMLITGMVLAGIPLKQAFGGWRSYVVVALRLIVLPVFFSALMYFVTRDPKASFFTAAMLCLPVGLNSVVFSKAYGGDAESGAAVCFLSTLFGLITIPLICAAATAVFGI